MHDKSLLKIIGFSFTVFSIISAFFAVFDLPLILQYAVFGCTLASLVIGLIMFKKVRGHNVAIKAVKKIVQNKPNAVEFEVRPIKNEIELLDYSQTDKDSYDTDAFSFELLKNMWKIYPYGANGLFDKNTNELIGACGLWPIKKTTFDEIIKGKKTEMDINARNIDKKAKQYWYIGGIYLIPKYRKTNAIKIFLKEILTSWHKEVKSNNVISIFSSAYSKDGELLLKKMGFRFIKNKLSEYPIYVTLDANPEALLKMFEGIFNVEFGIKSSSYKTEQRRNKLS